MEVDGAIALVTGANRGLGRAFVEVLLEQGAARVYAAARRSETLDAVIAFDPERVIPVALDITNDDDVTRAVSNSADVNLLVNNAGVLLNSGGFVSHPDFDALHHEFEVNFFGTLRMCREFAPILGRNHGGGIINILSILSLVTAPVVGSYCASKAAALSLTRGIRAELAAQGTRVIAAMPGLMDTDMGQHYDDVKMPPRDCVEASLDALRNGIDEIFPGEQSRGLSTAYFDDYAALEREMSGMLPE